VFTKCIIAVRGWIKGHVYDEARQSYEQRQVAVLGIRRTV